jgi:hypothetical protein
MKKYLFLVILAITTMASRCGDDKEGTTEKICEGEKDIKRYSLKIYIPENVLEEGKPVPTNIKELCLPICENLENIALNANDNEGNSSPLLIRMDNGYSESIATTDMGKMTDKKKIKPIYNHIRNFLNDEYKISKKVSEKFAPISPSKLDSLLNSFGTNNITLIYSEKTETGVYGNYKIVNSIDSLRYCIGQALKENPNKTVNVLYKVDVLTKDTQPSKPSESVPPVAETPPVKKKSERGEDLPPPPVDLGKWVTDKTRQTVCENDILFGFQVHTKTGKSRRVKFGTCGDKKVKYEGVVENNKSALDYAKGLPSIQVKPGDIESKNTTTKKQN